MRVGATALKLRCEASYCYPYTIEALKDMPADNLPCQIRSTCLSQWSMTLLTFSLSNVREQCWVWNNEGTEYFYDKHEWVRVRVEQEHWHDQSPMVPSESESAAATERKSPFSITVCCSDDSCGDL